VTKHYISYFPNCAARRIEIFFLTLFLFPGNGTLFFFTFWLYFYLFQSARGGGDSKMNDKVYAGLRYWYHQRSAQIQLCCVQTVPAIHTDHKDDLRNIGIINNFHTCQILHI